MPAAELTDWLDEFFGAEFVWLVKRLSGNDALANRFTAPRPLPRATR